jgi:PAS domain S-box-containing protein
MKVCFGWFHFTEWWFGMKKIPLRKIIDCYELRVAMIYWVFGIFWIYVSDTIIYQLSLNSDNLNTLQHYKGFIFVTTSALLIFLLIKYYFSIQRKIQIALEGSEAQLRLAVESARQGIYDVDLQNGKIVVNDIYAQMLGYDPDGFTETIETWLDRMHPDDSDFTRKYFLDFINGTIKKFQIEYRLRTVSGNYIWVLSSGRIVAFDGNGQPLRMMGTFIDISESKRLKNEKNLLSDLFESSLNEIYLFDPLTLLFKQVNKAALENLGYSTDEILTMTPIDLKSFANKDKFDRLVEPLRKFTKEQVIFESIHQRKDGTQYPVEIHLQLIQFGNENVFAGIVLDISEQKRTEDIIKSGREQLAGIIEGTNVGIWEWHVQTGELDVNERWARNFGYTLEEITPATIDWWFDIVHPDDIKAIKELIQRHFNGEIEHYEMVLRVKHKAGHWVWVLDRGKVTVWSENGKPILMKGTHQDITQQKIDEARITEQLNELSRWHAITLGREDRVLELKREVNRLLEDAGLPPKYDSVQD